MNRVFERHNERTKGTGEVFGRLRWVTGGVLGVGSLVELSMWMKRLEEWRI